MCRHPLLLLLSLIALWEQCNASNDVNRGIRQDEPSKRQAGGFGAPSAYGPCGPCPPGPGPVGCAPPIAALPPPPLAPIPPPPPAPAGRLIPQALPGAPCEPGVECTGGSVCSMGICLCPPELVQEGTVCVSRTIYGVVPPPGGLPPLPAVPAFAPPPPAPVVQFAPAPFPGFAAAAPAFPMVAAAPPPAPVCPPPFRAACVARRRRTCSRSQEWAKLGCSIPAEPRHGGLRETKKAKTIAATEQRRPTHPKTHTDLPPQQQQPDEEDILYTLADDDPNSLNSNSVEQSVEWSRKRR
ncbi:hypothetical protein GPALN_011065 [Globodera pallida]|nr:hypothetical protein GPALN_011065 [Globodera pallida]